MSFNFYYLSIFYKYIWQHRKQRRNFDTDSKDNINSYGTIINEWEELRGPFILKALNVLFLIIFFTTYFLINIKLINKVYSKFEKKRNIT